MADSLATLGRALELQVTQRKELFEVFGVETRNKYAIDADGEPFAFAAEQGKDALAFLARFFLGHFRTFEIHCFDSAQTLMFRAVHPFRWFFQRLDIVDASGWSIGSVEQRFSLLYKAFDILDASGQVLLRVRSPFFRPWTFKLLRYDEEVARIEKRWSGLLTEAFLDADRFRVMFLSPVLTSEARLLILAAALFVDLIYFERKAD